MAAKYILALLAGAFLIAGGAAIGRREPSQRRTWLLVGTIFAAVSLWLFARG
jgi:multidrug transporter EmrE-like cation transporter